MKLIANLGYGSRKQVTALFREGRITDANGEVLYADDKVTHEQVRVDSEPLDPPAGIVVMLHKPTGYTCSTKEAGQLVYDLLPPRFLARSPVVTSVGRLDKETSGLLLLTDDGGLLHRIVHPKSKLPKVYEVSLARDLQGSEGSVFASGTLQLATEPEPLAPAELEVLSARRVRLTLYEGRYHQARRMFAAVGNHVESLHRCQVGGLTLDNLEAGQWRFLTDQDRGNLFAGAHPAARTGHIT